MRAAAACACYLRYVVLVKLPLPRGSSLIWFTGLGPGFYLTLARPDTSFCQSQPGQMPVRAEHAEHADTYLQRRARLVAAAGLRRTWRRWLTEKRGESLAGRARRERTSCQSVPEAPLFWPRLRLLAFIFFCRQFTFESDLKYSIFENDKIKCKCFFGILHDKECVFVPFSSLWSVSMHVGCGIAFSSCCSSRSSCFVSVLVV